MDDEIQQLFEDAKAMHRLAVYYLGEEHGSIREPRLAVYWLRRAAALNYAPAIFDLGECFRRGFGVPTNEILAREHYRRCNGLYSSTDLTVVQSKVVEDEIVRMANLPGGEAIATWETESARLSEDFPDTWRWQCFLRKIVPSLVCCLAKGLDFDDAVSAAIHIDEDAKTAVAFVDPDLGWLQAFSTCSMCPGSTTTFKDYEDLCRIVARGETPEVFEADMAYGFRIRFLPTQTTHVLFPWKESNVGVVNRVRRWVLWSVHGNCHFMEYGFASKEEARDYLEKTFPWNISDFPQLVASAN